MHRVTERPSWALPLPAVHEVEGCKLPPTVCNLVSYLLALDQFNLRHLCFLHEIDPDDHASDDDTSALSSPGTSDLPALIGRAVSLVNEVRVVMRR